MDVVPIEVVPLKPPAARAGRPAVSDRGIAGAVLAVLQVPRQPAQIGDAQHDRGVVDVVAGLDLDVAGIGRRAAAEESTWETYQAP